MVADDLPWPELGNISRGATRGNQGSKGVVSQPDDEGRSLLQLRVHPGVLEVRLNRQASDWYRTLDNEVMRALKLTKTYWRKARRRQDYDARADQDHMELHEWLQQLKDKAMSHIEMLMQKGDIPGPPYIMPDSIELTFLRKFVERQAAGIPHNPRLREAGIMQNPPLPVHGAGGTPSPEPPEQQIHHPSMGWDSGERTPRLRPESDERDHNPNFMATPSQARHAVIGALSSSHIPDYTTLLQEAEVSKQLLTNARSNLFRAQETTQDFFAKYTASLESERKILQDVMAAEERRDALVAMLLRQNPPAGASTPTNGRLTPSRYHQAEAGASNARSHLERRGSNPSRMQPATWNDSLIDPHLPNSTPPMRSDTRSTSTHEGQAVDWSHGLNFQSSEARMMDHDLPRPAVPSPQMISSERANASRKHVRSWEQGQLQDVGTEVEDASVLPPRKRMHQLSEGIHMVASNLGASIPDMPMTQQGVIPSASPPHIA
ncbi:hypothetical protein JAAARDRAFT_36371 [Jaapia argillacea MUCL 33604]|uniref:Uncharacterized protein n=1 Tax=Jaapia argillacea MUCL 33604 TaxID=933084 RepID=A0A067PQ15_9AGAM|nr:hypothetical protein JAAARDRAFT_36371 [Jaapia argillacea MUCL 33604]